MKRIYISFFAILMSLSAMPQDHVDKAVEAMSQTNIEAHIGFLASDEMSGRQAGTQFSAISAQYIAAQLQTFGVRPLGDSYFHPFSAVRNERSKRGYWEVSQDSIDAFSGRVHRRLDMNNVLGYIEGRKKDEYIVIGAHFDHLGTDNTLAGDKIYNGADDNASGVAALLEIARNYAAMGQQPERSIIFAFWDGEEIGLLGSMAFAERFDMDKVKAYINFDMIGRTTYGKARTHVVYFYTSGNPSFKKWAKESINKYELELEPDYRGNKRLTSGSDNATFSAKDIPFVWFHTDGHPDYHQPSDHADKVDVKKVRDIACVAFFDLYKMANYDF